MRNALGLLAVLVVCGLAGAGVAVGWAHWSIRQDRPVLAGAEALLAGSGDADLPVRIRWIETARQVVPRRNMLDPSRDPSPASPYAMTVAAFAVEWADGRLLLVDLGMTPEGARKFGRPLALLAGAEPITVYASAAEQIGETSRVHGVVFSHLHDDHVEGVRAFCDRHQGTTPMPFYVNEGQAERPNYLTRGGLGLLRESWCMREERLSGASAALLPGFPGVRVGWVAGHTPGSQIVVVHVRGSKGVRPVVFAGDVVNVIDGVLHDVPKPWLYRTLVVPEDDTRLQAARRLLRELADRGAAIMPAHDARHLEAIGVERWTDGLGQLG